MKLTQEKITSRKNPLVLLAASLSEKKYRDEHGLFAAPGYKLCCEAIATGAPVSHVLLSEEYAALHLDEIMDKFTDERYADTVLTILSEGCFEKITTEKAPEGIILLIKHLDIYKKYIKIKDVGFFDVPERAVFLHSIRDPGNLGTIIRSAGAFGFECVLLSEDCADLYHPRTVRAAMGAIFRVPTLRVSDSVQAVRELARMGRRTLAAELRPRALPIHDIGLCAGDVIMIGNEGHGIPEDVSSECAASVYIPIAPSAESLNAAAAAAVLLWEHSKIR